MFRIVVSAAAWLSLALIAYATLSPFSDRPEIDAEGFFQTFANLDRYVAFAVAGGLFGLAYPRQLSFVCVVVFASAVLLELAQMLTPDRHARVADALQKTIGGAIGIAFARLIISLGGIGLPTSKPNA
jgi:VanZ family protein